MFTKLKTIFKLKGKNKKHFKFLIPTFFSYFNSDKIEKRNNALERDRIIMQSIFDNERQLKAFIHTIYAFAYKVNMSEPDRIKILQFIIQRYLEVFKTETEILRSSSNVENNNL